MNALILTDSLPDWVFALIVTVLDVLFAPFPLNLTVNSEDSPGRRGALLQSWGTVHPHVDLISLITNGASPVLVYEKIVSTGVPSSIDPKS